MSSIKISENLFLGKQELNRFRDFIEKFGFRKLFGLITKKFGVVKTTADIGFNSLKIIQGSTPNKLSLSSGFAIDKNSQIIEVDSLKNDILTIPTDSNPYKVIITYNTTNLEKGTVSLDASGQLTGIGTEFTQVLRGLPHHRLKIKFPNSLQNTQEYVVNVVNNNLSATIQGASFVAESNLNYIVIGAFTPGAFIPNENKQIYSYDSFLVFLAPDSFVLADGVHFLLANVSTNGTNLTITDQRYSSLYSISSDESELILQSSNPVSGIEWIRYDSVLIQTGGENFIKFSWGVKSPDGFWQSNLFLNKIEISSVFGGIMNDISSFVDGSFDGWRLYFNDGKYRRILSSTISSGILNLEIEDYSSFLPTSGDITIVPNSDSIIVEAKSTVLPQYYEMPLLFSIEKGYGIFKIPAGPVFTLRFKYKTLGFTSPWITLNDGVFLAPTSFNSNGVQIGNDTLIVSNGEFTSPINSLGLFSRIAYIVNNNTYAAGTTNDFLGQLISRGKNSMKGQVILGPSSVQTVSNSSNILTVDKVDMNLGAISATIFSGFQGEEEGKIFILRCNWDSVYNITIEHLSASIPPRQRISLKNGANLILTPGKVAQFMHVTPDSNAANIIGFGWIQI